MLIELLCLHSSSTTATWRAGVSCWARLQQELFIMLQWEADRWVQYNTSEFLPTITTDQHSEWLHSYKQPYSHASASVIQLEKTKSLPETIHPSPYIHTVQLHTITVQKVLLEAIHKHSSNTTNLFWPLESRIQQQAEHHKHHWLKTLLWLTC